MAGFLRMKQTQLNHFRLDLRRESYNLDPNSHRLTHQDKHRAPWRILNMSSEQSAEQRDQQAVTHISTCMIRDYAQASGTGKLFSHLIRVGTPLAQLDNARAVQGSKGNEYNSSYPEAKFMNTLSECAGGGVAVFILPQMDGGPGVFLRRCEQTGVLAHISPPHASRSYKDWDYGRWTAEQGTPMSFCPPNNGINGKHVAPLNDSQ
ncbi:hypothetical protein EYF80_014508 [Liparis tanakae]|uniref:Uncharacterized protein n=1 Tax=Liparis tanakae TaxID=230148 RepID=A0A4Z2IC36_9TELE|nr:hypothetical protein EYF80_014508 [Liparis tanakae]